MNFLLSDGAANLWTVLPTILWVLLILIVLLMFRTQLVDTLTHLTRRIRSGGTVKFGTIELGAVRTTDKPLDSQVTVPKDNNHSEKRESERNNIYRESRGTMLVHQLYRSDEIGQHYDILIYLIPHKEATLIQVTHVEYFLGSYGWGKRIFRCTDRAHGFSLLTAAYGPFLCTAHVHFNDGTHHSLSRYIDFEMGAYAPFLEHHDE